MNESYQMKVIFKPHEYDYVYAFRCGKRFVKVGKTTDVATRLKGMSLHNPFRITVERCLYVERHALNGIEKWFHNQLKRQRTHHEWFSATTKTVNAVFDKAVETFEEADECNEWLGVVWPDNLPAQYDRYFFEPKRDMEKDAYWSESESEKSISGGQAGGQVLSTM